MHRYFMIAVKYLYSGQNIALIGSSDDFTEAKATIRRIFSLWFNEYKYTDMKMNCINLFRPSKWVVIWKSNLNFILFHCQINKYFRVKIGHFTQIVNDRNVEIGCGASKYKKGIFYYWYIACNYSSANILAYSIYKSGTSCSNCKSGCDTHYPALCSMAESIDPNYLEKWSCHRNYWKYTCIEQNYLEFMINFNSYVVIVFSICIDFNNQYYLIQYFTVI